MKHTTSMSAVATRSADTQDDQDGSAPLLGVVAELLDKLDLG